MANVQFENKTYALNEDETLLEGLLRHQVDYPHSCKAGTCQSCLCRTDSDNIDPTWQKGLKPTVAAKGYILPCISRVQQDISITLPSDDDIATVAEIAELLALSHNVFCVRLTVNNLDSWTPGQYLNLVNPNGVIRSYSIANLPVDDGYIELHIKIMPSGVMGHWLTTEAKVGDSVTIRGPIGDCYYCNPNHKAFPIVLVGTGTGAAPLLAIARDAIKQQHQGDIYFLHGGVTVNDLYLDSQLKALAEQYDNFFYESCVLEEQADIKALMLKTLSVVTKPMVYICGPSEITLKLKKQAFLSGVSLSRIYSDAFISPVPDKPQ
tara:strand:+ start:46109 stop:47074 length:966 start_codon:yes stop_codon:yes gene_type:complete